MILHERSGPRSVSHFRHPVVRDRRLTGNGHRCWHTHVMVSHANSDSVLDLRYIDNRSRREILQTFWNRNGLSDRARVYAVLTLTLTSSRLRYRSRNSAENHAEVNMLTFLRERHSHDDLKNQRIVMYISTSPCYFCSRQIETLVADLGVTLELVLAGLHHINRPSSAPPHWPQLPPQERVGTERPSAGRSGHPHVQRSGLGHFGHAGVAGGRLQLRRQSTTRRRRATQNGPPVSSAGR